MRRVCQPAEGKTSSVAPALAAPAFSSSGTFGRRPALSGELEEFAQAVEIIQANSASAKAEAPTTKSTRTGPPPRCAHSSPAVYPGWAAQTYHPIRPTPETCSYAKPAKAMTSPGRRIRVNEQGFRAGTAATRRPVEIIGNIVAANIYDETAAMMSELGENMFESVEVDKTSETVALSASASQTSASAPASSLQLADRC